MPLNALNVEETGKVHSKESVYQRSILDLGKIKGAILKDWTHKNEQSFIWNALKSLITFIF